MSSKYSEKKRRQREQAAKTDSQSQPKAAAAVLTDEQKLRRFAGKLEQQMVSLEEAFQSEDWAAKDRFVLRALALARYGIDLYSGRTYRLQLAYRAARAYHALHPSKMREHLERFEREMNRCLEGIEVIPDQLIATLHKAHQRVTQFGETNQPGGDRRAFRKQKPSSAAERAASHGHALKGALLSTGVHKTRARQAPAAPA